MMRRLKRQRRSIGKLSRRKGYRDDILPPIARYVKRRRFIRSLSTKSAITTKKIRRLRARVVRLSERRRVAPLTAKLRSRLNSLAVSRSFSRGKVRLKCREVVRADQVRRHEFFRARAKGASSSRPEHRQRHKRKC